MGTGALVLGLIAAYELLQGSSGDAAQRRAAAVADAQARADAAAAAAKANGIGAAIGIVQPIIGALGTVVGWFKNNANGTVSATDSTGTPIDPYTYNPPTVTDPNDPNFVGPPAPTPDPNPISDPNFDPNAADPNNPDLFGF